MTSPPAHGAPAPGTAPPPGCPAHAGAPAGAPAASLYSPEFAADPTATYERLRAAGPLAPVELTPGVRARLVVGYEAALHVLRSPETFSKDARLWADFANGTVPPDSPVLPMMAFRPNALFTHGEEHRRLREAITDSLARVEADALRGYVERAAEMLIDRFAPAGRADLLGQYARVLPLLVFNQMFGCPPEIGDRLVQGMSGIFDGVAPERANALLTGSVLELVALKRARPGPDVTSWLIAHPAGLSDEELLHTLVVLMGAGTEPEQNLIANSLRLLLSDDRFAGDLAGGSMPVEDALDEVLWTDPPMANYGVHYPMYDTVYEGTVLAKGTPLVISFAAANNDPALAADRHAGTRAGNRAHLAWSAGPHVCPAQGPARLIAGVAIETLLDRLPDLELAVPAAELQWRPGPFHRALATLPVRFPPASAAPATSALALAFGPGPAARRPGESGGGPPRAADVPGTPDTPRGRGVWAGLRAWWRGD
ncbi:cytochrome P450 [Streptomyces sp. NPDC048172]|uniref:cytochrome P450 n=1 Tax=Streptomyces sp. NPDC048172 TaxID=3365505 RepID=UPI0037155FE8